ncbi:LPD38 domain-containing protein [Caviibacterium pharyngocola]|uniref:Large polyvalent protein-associated domain-containing protein n=1 Tax=Caviibacterium pharyngocola TaxID=28159 RepID=A0A2M8RXZ8_9PAST|nr:LPD38 domain-containing protein [Caviibacterium pharyngocola]PJG83755.1 hypothetical protein CVP04_02535 [Caviibacterium pharyngocola]
MSNPFQPYLDVVKVQAKDLQKLYASPTYDPFTQQLMEQQEAQRKAEIKAQAKGLSEKDQAALHDQQMQYATELGRQFVAQNQNVPIEQQHYNYNATLADFDRYKGKVTDETLAEIKAAFSAVADPFKRADEEAGFFARAGDFLSYVPSALTKFGEQATGLISPESEARQWFTNATKEVESWRSDEAKLRALKMAEASAQAKANGETGFTQFLENAWDNPIEALGQFAESALPTIASAVAGTAAAPFTGGASLTLPFMVGGVQGAGAARNDIFDYIMAMPEEQLSQAPQYQALLAQGMGKHQARTALASSLKEHGGEVLATGVSSAALNALGGLGRLGQAGRGVASSATGKFLSEAITEPVDEVFQTAMANKAIRDVDSTKSITDDLGEAAAAGLLFGAAGGAIAGVDQARMNRDLNQHNQADIEEMARANSQVNLRQFNQEYQRQRNNPVNAHLSDIELQAKILAEMTEATEQQEEAQQPQQQADYTVDSQGNVQATEEQQEETQQESTALSSDTVRNYGNVDVNVAQPTFDETQQDVIRQHQSANEMLIKYEQEFTQKNQHLPESVCEHNKQNDVIYNYLKQAQDSAVEALSAQNVAFLNGAYLPIKKQGGATAEQIAQPYPSNHNAEQWRGELSPVQTQTTTQLDSTIRQPHQPKTVANEQWQAVQQYQQDLADFHQIRNEASARFKQSKDPKEFETETYQNALQKALNAQQKMKALGVPVHKSIQLTENVERQKNYRFDVNNMRFSRMPIRSSEENIARGSQAMEQAIQGHKDVENAMFRDGVGWIDFIWGTEGTVKASGKTKGGKGISHIIEARMRKDNLSYDEAVAFLTEEVPNIIANGRIERDYEVSGTRAIAIIRNDGSEVHLIKKGNDNAWLLTGFKPKESQQMNQSGGATSSDLRSSSPIRSRTEEGAVGINNVNPTAQNVNDDITQIRALLEQHLGKEFADKIEISQTQGFPENAEKLRSSGAEGFYLNGKIHLFADNLTETRNLSRNERIVWVAWHELAHRGFDVKDKETFYNILRLAATNNFVRGIANRIVREYRSSGDTITAKVAMEEALVELYAALETGNLQEIADRYGIELTGEMQRAFNGTPNLLDRIMRALRAMFSRVLKKRLTNSEAGELLRSLKSDMAAEVKSAVENSQEQTGSAESYIRYSFAGEKAKTADHSLLEQAKADIAKGVNPEIVRQETGWFRGVDGKWRFEISDNEVSFKKTFDKNANFSDIFEAARNEKSSDDIRVKDILNAPKLFEAYPDIADINVELDLGDFPNMENSEGFYVHANQPHIFIKPHLTPEQARGTLLHEIQHHTQGSEGFANGSNPSEFNWITRELTPEEQAEISSLKETQEEILNSDPQLVGLVSQYRQEVKKLREKYRSQHIDDIPTAEKTQYETLMNQIASLNENGEIFVELEGIISSIGRDSPDSQYMRMAGEVEARNVQERMDMTAEQRRQISPESTEDVARDSQIVSQQDGMTYSLNENQSAVGIGKNTNILYSHKGKVNRPKSESLEKLRKAETIRISGKDIEPSTDLKQYKRNALNYGKALRGTYVNKDTGQEIELGYKAVKEVLQHDYKDPDHLQSIAAIPQIIEQAIYIDTIPNEDKTKRPDIESYDYYLAGLNIGGDEYTVRAAVATLKDGSRYYDHKLSEIEKGDLLSLPSRITNPVGESSSPLSEIDDKRLLQILQDKSAVEIKENSAISDKARFSRSQSALNRTKDINRIREKSLFEKVRTTNYNTAHNAVKESALNWAAKLDEWFADSLRPVSDWLAKISLTDYQQLRIKNAMYTAKSRKAAKGSEFDVKYLNPLRKNLAELAKKHKVTIEGAKRFVEQWASARYAIIKNQDLLAKDELAMQQAKDVLENEKASGNAESIEIVQKAYDEASAKYNGRKQDIERTEFERDEQGHLIKPMNVGTAGGWSNAEAKAIMKNVEKVFSVSELENTLKPLYGLLQEKLEMDFSSGRISYEMYQEFKKNPLYVPLTGDPNAEFDLNEDNFIGGTGSNAMNIAKDKAMQGRTVSEAEGAIDASWKALGKSITNWAWADFKNEIDSALMEKAAQFEALGVAPEIAMQNAQKMLRIEKARKQGLTRSSDDVLIHKIGGVDYEYRLPQSVITALRQDNVETANSFLKVISKPTGWYARGVTQWNIAFAPLNMFRDMWEKSEFLRTRTLYDKNGNKLKNMDKIARQALKYAIDKESWNATRREAFGQKALSDVQKDLQELQKLGGISTYGTYLARTEQDLLKEIAKEHGWLSKRLGLAGKALASYNQMFDNLSSLAVYRALLDAGMEKSQAAAAVLDLTNFNKTGSKMRGIKTLYMFSQPTVMGAANLIKQLSTKTGQKRFAAYLVSGLVLYAMVRAMGDDDEGGNTIDQLGDITRYIPIPTGGGDYIKIPVGFGMPQMAWNFAVNMFRSGNGDISITDAAVNMAAHSMKTFAPVSPSEISAAKFPMEKLALTFTPSVLQPIMQNALNRNAFGSQITPGFIQKDKTKAEQAKSTTAQFWKETALWLNDNLGIDMHPEQIKNLVDGYGSMAGSLKEGLTIFVENPNREQLGRNTRTPFINQIYGTGNDFAIQSRYYEASEEAAQIAAQYASRVERGEVGDWLTTERRRAIAFHEADKSYMANVRKEKAALTRKLTKGLISQQAYEAGIKNTTRK